MKNEELEEAWLALSKLQRGVVRCPRESLQKLERLISSSEVSPQFASRLRVFYEQSFRYWLGEVSKELRPIKIPLIPSSDKMDSRPQETEMPSRLNGTVPG